LRLPKILNLQETSVRIQERFITDKKALAATKKKVVLKRIRTYLQISWSSTKKALLRLKWDLLNKWHKVQEGIPYHKLILKTGKHLES
jgi:hypothetical protein